MIARMRRAFRRIIGSKAADREPDSVMLDICTACTAKCIYCLHQRRRMVAPRRMSDETFLKIVDILRDEGFRLVYLYMSGEPLLHPGLPRFISEVARRHLLSSTATKIYVPISVQAFDAALAVCDAEKMTAELLVTIDALNQEAQDKIAPGIRTRIVLDNLTRLAELKARHSSASIICDTVVNRWNEDQLNDIQRELAAMGFNSWYAKTMGYYMSYAATPQDVAAITESLPALPEFKQRFDVRQGEIVSYRKTCEIGCPAIGMDGNVTLCCHDMLHKISVGNILQEGSLRRILRADPYLRTAAAGREMKLDICKHCN